MYITDFASLTSKIGEKKVEVAGFVHSIRDHGGLIFVDVRSNGELLQCTANPTLFAEAFAVCESLHNEYTVVLKGTVQARDSDAINPNIATGKIELMIELATVISTAKPMPFNIHAEDNQLAGEEIRLKYRYLDLRREKLHKLMKTRHKMFLEVRNWFDAEDFVEIATPILANSSPEGARDFLVPSRLQQGSFYALPQAPQQFKQLLMVGGFSKYFQIAACFRDEDPRADRAYGEFYQIDAEIAWADPEYIRALSEKLVREVFSKFTAKKLASPEFIQIDHAEALEKYGSDKPDLRYDLAWKDVKPLFVGSGFGAFANLCGVDTARVQALIVPGGADKFSRSDLDKVQEIGRSFGLPGIAYIQVGESEMKSPIFKFLADSEAEIEAKKAEIKQYLGLKNNDLVLFIANENRHIVYKAQHEMRKYIGRHLTLIDDSVMQFVWINNFPFFEKDEKTGKIEFGHNPFSVWKGGLATLQEAQTKGEEALLALKAQQYDIAVNGYEVLSGGVRNQDPVALREVFKICGYTDEEVESKFGHMLEAYSYGAPTHAGFAWGIDRLFMVLVGEENIREIFAFPKNGSGFDLMMKSPSDVRDSQLKELGIKVLNVKVLV